MKNVISVFLTFFSFALFSNTFADFNTTWSASDNNGNIIVIGYCLGNVRIAEEEFTFTTPSAFILKLNPDGEKIWLKIFSCQSINARAVSTDTLGNIYVTGEFAGTVNFDSFSLTSQGTDAFIVKLNNSGDVEWVKHGTSVNTARGNCIFIKDNYIFVSGDGNPITFDSLTISSSSGGGYIATFSLDGEVLNLFFADETAGKIVLDKDNDIIAVVGHTSPPLGVFSYFISKFSMSGILKWLQYFYSISICVDINKNIYAISPQNDFDFTLSKFNEDGILYKSKLFGQNNSTNIAWDLIANTDQTIFCGYYNSGFHFGDSTFQSNGQRDFFIASVDSGLNPLWFKHGGGLKDDNFIRVILSEYNSLVITGTFNGTINIDTVQITGGTSGDTRWTGIVKYDLQGNFLWIKKIVEHFIPTETFDWFPLEVGNQFQYFGNSFGKYNVKSFKVVDSIWINNKKYYSVDGFYTYPNGTKLRYDKTTQQILVLDQEQEYLCMDFSKVPGEIFTQYLGRNYFLSFVNNLVIVDTAVFMGDTIPVKGFYNHFRLFGGITYITHDTWYYFAPENGLVLQKGKISSERGQEIFNSVEYLVFKDGQIIHKKHSEYPTLNFEPVTFIPQSDSLYCTFTIEHPFSKQNVPASQGYYSYMIGTMESFYSNGLDTIWNSTLTIDQTSETSFVLNYHIDTLKYNQGYKLFYRIVAYDKAIIKDTLFSPQTGYYKLFWKDSTTFINQTEFEAITYSLLQNYPNPFNPSCKIVFTIPTREKVSLKVFDILGNEIADLIKDDLDSGKYEVDFNAQNLSSGVYIYQLKAGNYKDNKKMILLR